MSTNQWARRLGLAFADGCDMKCVADAETQAVVSDLTRRADEAVTASAITFDYPLEGTLFPPDLAAPTFVWHDASETADIWLVVVNLDKGAVRLGILSSGETPAEEMDSRLIGEGLPAYKPNARQLTAKKWKPDEAVWSLVAKRSVSSTAQVTILGLRKADFGKPVSKGAAAFSISRDPVGAPIFYRDVPLVTSPTEKGVIKPLPTAMVPLIEWRLRDVSKPASRLMLSNLYTCANCHSFSADGKTLGMDVDGPTGDKGAYALVPIATDTVIRTEGIITWNAFKGKLPDRNTIGFLSRVSPDGRYVVSTVNESVYVANFPDYRFLEVFYPTRGTLALYSRATGEFKALPGADNPEYVHCDAVWSPDGKWLVFARAKARDSYSTGPKPTNANDTAEIPLQYDLYKLSFNDGLGGTPEPVQGASNDGVSHSFPAISPDGKWIVFVSCRNGQLIRPDSILWIVPSAGGVARKMRCNTPLMNSWHSFSPNGRWMVFSSKANTPFTQMFLTHIDEEGNDTPAVLVENATTANRAVNIPEFVNMPYDSFQRISMPTLAFYADFFRAGELADKDRVTEAIEAYTIALRNYPDDSRIHNDLGIALGRLDMVVAAERHFRRAIEINPGKPQAYANLALVLTRMGKFLEAAERYDKAIDLDATTAETWFSRGWVRQCMGRMKDALTDYDEAIRLDPTIPQAWDNRGVLRVSMGNTNDAMADYAEAIRVSPNYTHAYLHRARLLADLGKRDEAFADINKAIEIDPQSPAVWYERSVLRARKGDTSGAKQDLHKCLEVAPSGWPDRERVKQMLQERASQKATAPTPSAAR